MADLGNFKFDHFAHTSNFVAIFKHVVLFQTLFAPPDPWHVPPLQYTRKRNFAFWNWISKFILKLIWKTDRVSKGLSIRSNHYYSVTAACAYLCSSASPACRSLPLCIPARSSSPRFLIFSETLSSSVVNSYYGYGGQPAQKRHPTFLQRLRIWLVPM